MVEKIKGDEKQEKAAQHTLEEILNNDPLVHSSRHTVSGKAQNGPSTILFLGELALGTKACDPRIYRGLAYFLEANGLDKEIGHVVASGGLLPYIPTFYGVQNAREMVFLGNNWDQKIDERTKLMLGSGISKEDRDFIEKWVAYKITNTSQAVEYTKTTMAPLTALLNEGTVWHYLHGEEDNKNIEALTEININNYIEAGKDQQKNLEKKTLLEKDIERLQKEEKQYNAQSQLLREIRQQLHPSHDKEKVNQYLTEFFKAKASDIESLENSEKFKKLLTSIDSRQDVTTKIEELEQYQKQAKETAKKKDRELKDTINDLNAKKREAEAQQFHRITKRRRIQPNEAEFLRWEAKKEYVDSLYASLPDVTLKVHGGHEVDLVLDSVRVTLAHKAQMRSSSPGMSDVKNIKGKILNRNKHGLPVSDINVSFHGAGGLRMEPINANTENIESYVQRETPRISMAMQLSTMQSVPQLQTLMQKNIKNDHTRRLESGDYSSGAVLYKVEPTGEHNIQMITFPQLLEACKVGDKLAELKGKYSAAKKEEKDKIKDQMKLLEKELKLNRQKGAILTDIHLGCPNKEGRPSNYDILESAKYYLEKNGLPEVLVLNGDNVHGVLERHFGSNEQYYARLPSDIRKKIDEIKASQKDPLQKIADLEYLCSRELSHMVPISLVSKQLREAKRRLAPLMHAVLDKGGYVLITSGNHHNETTKFLDEATDIANLVDLKYLDNPKLKEFVGLGEKYGVGEATLENGWKVYCSHGPMRGSDNVQGAMRQIRGGNKKPNMAFFGHVHQSGAGHTGEAFITIGAGMQPWNPFVDKVGMQASLRGMITFEYDSDKKGYFGWKFVLDPTLEREEYKRAG